VDISLILLSGSNREWWAWYAFLVTVGEVMGGYLTYRLAEKGGQATLEKKIGKPRAEKLYERFEKRGFIMVFTGSILPAPFPFIGLLMAAGIMQYPRKKFFFALTAGRAIRFYTVAWLGRIYGAQMIAFLARHYKPATYFLIGVSVATGIGALVYFKWYRPRHTTESPAGQAQISSR
jgi:membrane protein YqaA with SNARE-associated domain